MNILQPKAQHPDVHVINMFKYSADHLIATFSHQTLHTFQLHSVNSVLNSFTGKEVRIKPFLVGSIEGQDSKTWPNSHAHEISRIPQGYGTTKKFKTFVFILVSKILTCKKIAFPCFVCNVKPNKAKKTG